MDYNRINIIRCDRQVDKNAFISHPFLLVDEFFEDQPGLTNFESDYQDMETSASLFHLFLSNILPLRNINRSYPDKSQILADGYQKYLLTTFTNFEQPPSASPHNYLDCNHYNLDLLQICNITKKKRVKTCYKFSLGCIYTLRFCN